MNRRFDIPIKMHLAQEINGVTAEEMNKCRKGEIELGPPESIKVKRNKVPR